MNKLQLVVGGIAVLVALLVSSAPPIVAGEKEESTAIAIVTYLISGRTVLSRNQALINDAAKGDKGFTPDVYAEQVNAEFMKRIGIKIADLTPDDPFGKAILDVHLSAKEVVAEAQEQINVPNKAFKGFNPAVFGARVGAKLAKRSGIELKQTSLQYRGDYNKPDAFESQVIKKFETGAKDQNHYEELVVNGKKVARYLVPVYIEKTCLTCHGDPKGSLDVSGRVKEGYKEGELRGAISVSLPFN